MKVPAATGSLPASRLRSVELFSSGAWRSEGRQERLHFFCGNRRSACGKHLYLSGPIEEPHFDESLWADGTAIQCARCRERVERVQKLIKESRSK